MTKVLVTGGLGFIGSNLVLDRLHRGDQVIVFDDSSRSGAERNRFELLQRAGSHLLTFVTGDVRDGDLVSAATRDVEVVFHLAGQVAVTTSIQEPRIDFDVNATGTLNVLEAARAATPTPIVVYSSTNKVYGGLEEIKVTRVSDRYELDSLPFGISELTPLSFHSPYACSKGTGDQYVIDYATTYDLRTVVFRQSCIYGPFQHGNEDQGWIAHFAIRALQGEGVTIYGDGYQVRDVLYVADLIDAYHRVLTKIGEVAGRAYNIGGGPKYTTSLIECIRLLERTLGTSVSVIYKDWRRGDQRVYVSDVRRAFDEFGWAPMTPLVSGIVNLLDWLRVAA